MKGLITLVVSLALVIGANAARAGDEAAAKAKTAAAARKMHQVSVFSYVQDWRGRNAPVPVLVTMNVKGRKSLVLFCDNFPRVQATVLKMLLSGTQRSRRRGAGVASLEAPLKDAVAEMFPAKAMQALDLKVGRRPSDFANDLQHTSKACDALKS